MKIGKLVYVRGLCGVKISKQCSHPFFIAYSLNSKNTLRFCYVTYVFVCFQHQKFSRLNYIELYLIRYEFLQYHCRQLLKW